MGWVSIAAIYFIVWWLSLFAVLPFGLRTQEEEGDVSPGTVPSAPRGPHMFKAVVRATIVSAIIVGAFVYVTRGLGYSFDDIPRVVPNFD